MNLSTVFSSRRSAFLLSRMFLLFVFTVGMMTPTAMRGQGPLPVTTAVVGPVTPTYIDPVSLAVTVTSSTGTVATGTITYTVDAGAVQTATVSNGAALIQLGMFAPGGHAVTYLYNGNVGATTNVATAFTVSDLPFRLVGSEQTVIYNHGGFSAVVSDSHDNMFLTNSNENNLYKLDTQRNLTVVETNGLSNPQGIAVDPYDNLYIADTGNNRVVMLTPAGVQTTMPFTGLSGPTTLAFDSFYGYVYVNDLGNGRIVRLTPGSNVQTTVVTGISRITGLAVDQQGNLYFGQHYSTVDGTLYELDFRGNLTSGLYGLKSPDALSIDASGNLYVTDDGIGLDEIDSSGHLTHLDSFAGAPVAVDHTGQVYVLGIYSFVVTQGTAAKMANAGAVGIGGPNSRTTNNTVIFQVPYQQTLTSVDLTTGGAGNLARTGNPTCQSLGQCSEGITFGPAYPGSHTGYIVATLSNNATLQSNFYGVGFNSNEAFDPGMRTTAQAALRSAGGMAEAEDHTIYVTDPTANKVYSLGVGGTSTPVALAFTGLTGPAQIAVDGSKNVFVLDAPGQSARVLELTSGGAQTTVYDTQNYNLVSITAMTLDGSGTLLLAGEEGEGGAILDAFMPGIGEVILGSLPADPTALALDGVGGLYEVDTTTSTLRKYVYGGGNTTQGKPVTLATGIASPVALAVEPSGTVFVAQSTAGTLLQVRPDGTTATLYSKLGAASAVVEDGRGVLTLLDGTSGTLYLDDRRTMAYNFGTQAVGASSAPVTSTINNDGNQPLNSIEGLPGDSIFTQVVEANACTAAGSGTVLALGAFCQLDYTFTPAAPQLYTEADTEQDGTETSGSGVTYRSLTFSGTGKAVQAAAALSPASLSFQAASGTIAPSQTVSLMSTGTAPLNVGSSAITGVNASAFTIVYNACGTQLASGTSCPVTVECVAATTGSYTAALTFTDDASPTTQSAALTCQETGAPQAMLTPATQDFGSAAVGLVSAANYASFTLANTGSTALTNTFAVSGTNAAYFSIASNTCTNPLAAGASCTIGVQFAPTATGSFSATLAVTSVSGATTLMESSALTGKGTPGAMLTATPNPAVFPATQVGVSAAPLTVTLTNTGGATVQLQTTIGTLGGADATAFTYNSACGSMLAAGASCNLSFTFTPNAVRTFNATFSVPSNDPNSPTLIALTGKGLAAGTLTISPVVQAFPSTVIGSVSAAQTSVISNTTTQAIYLSTGTLTDAADFTQSNNCNGLLAANATCTVTFTFQPQTTGALSSVYSIYDLNHPASPLTVALSGNGAGVAAATLTPATAAYGNIAVGAVSAAQTFTLTNSGTAALPVTSVTVSGAAFAIKTNGCGATLAAGARCTILVSFVPTSAGPASGTLSVVDTVGTQTSTLSGTGTSAADFTLTSSPSSQSTYKGTTVNYTITLSSVGGGVFTGPVALTASGLPSGATLNFSPATVSSSANTSTMTITVPALVGSNAVERGSIAFASLIAVGLMFTRRRRLLPRLLLLLLALTGATFVSGCGTGAGFGIPTTTSTITVTGTSGALTHTTSVMLTVK